MYMYTCTCISCNLVKPAALSHTVFCCLQVYFANVHPKFPNGGKMSQHLNSLSVGDTVDISGPAGKVVYLGRGYIRVKLPGKPEQIRFATDVGLIAGGTGKGSGEEIGRASCMERV